MLKCFSRIFLKIEFEINEFVKRNDFRELKIQNNIFVGLEYSVSKEIYDGINENIQKMDKILRSIIMKYLFPCVMFSKFITSYFAYFTTDLGCEAFELPFPYW